MKNFLLSSQLTLLQGVIEHLKESKEKKSCENEETQCNLCDEIDFRNHLRNDQISYIEEQIKNITK